MPKRKLKYDLIDKAKPAGKRQIEVEFDADDVAYRIPVKGSMRDVLSALVQEHSGTHRANTISDVLRFLDFSNFVTGVDNLDGAFPFRGAIPEAEREIAGRHLSGRTNAVGAALHLLLSTEANAQAKATLGGLVWSLAHAKRFGGTAAHQGQVVIDD